MATRASSSRARRRCSRAQAADATGDPAGVIRARHAGRGAGRRARAAGLDRGAALLLSLGLSDGRPERRRGRVAGWRDGSWAVREASGGGGGVGGPGLRVGRGAGGRRRPGRDLRARSGPHRGGRGAARLERRSRARRRRRHDRRGRRASSPRPPRRSAVSTSSSPTPAALPWARSPRRRSTTTPRPWSSTCCRWWPCATPRCPAMQAQGWGRVVAITSISVRQPIANLILSNTARAGATGFLKTIAREVAADGVTVNSVQPGLHLTDRIKAVAGDAARCPGARHPGRLPRRRRRLRQGRGLPVLRTGPVRDRRPPPGRRRFVHGPAVAPRARRSAS